MEGVNGIPLKMIYPPFLMTLAISPYLPPTEMTPALLMHLIIAKIYIRLYKRKLKASVWNEYLPMRPRKMKATGIVLPKVPDLLRQQLPIANYVR